MTASYNVRPALSGPPSDRARCGRRASAPGARRASGTPRGGDLAGGVEQVELARNDHHRKVGEARLLPDEAEQLNAVEPGQPEIEEHHVRFLAGELAQRLQPVSGLEHAEPLRTEEGRVHPPGVRVVLDEQHTGHSDNLGSPWLLGNVNAEEAGGVPLPPAPTPTHAGPGALTDGR